MGGNQGDGSYTGARSAAPFAILDSIYEAYKKINTEYDALRVDKELDDPPLDFPPLC